VILRLHSQIIIIIIIRQVHDKGHLSAIKTEQILRKDYLIPNLRAKIEKIVRNCVSCILVERK